MPEHAWFSSSPCKLINIFKLVIHKKICILIVQNCTENNFKKTKTGTVGNRCNGLCLVSGGNVQYVLYCKLKPDICRCICSSRDRLSLQAEDSDYLCGFAVTSQNFMA